jgi:transcription initiation factor TFIIE subunit alpha
MANPKSKFKIGKSPHSTSYHSGKKTKSASSKTTAAGASPALFFRRKAPYSKAKKIYPPRKTSNADIIVKRSCYSKAVRAVVLADAAARQRLIDMGGENTINIIREFDRDMSDDELAKKTGIKPSEVRVVLNRLHSRGVFAYTRVRDKDSGWYSYIWKMDEGRLKDVGSLVIVGEAALAVSREGYRCSSCSPQRIMDFSDAEDARFRCGGCGSCLEYVDARRNKD